MNDAWPSVRWYRVTLALGVVTAMTLGAAAIVIGTPSLFYPIGGVGAGMAAIFFVRIYWMRRGARREEGDGVHQ